MSSPTPNLIIHGAHAGDVWVENAGELVCLTRRDIAHLSRWVIEHGIATLAGNTFDEADVIELAAAANGPQLADCHACEGPGLIPIEGRLHCPGHAAGFGAAEEASA